MVSPTLRLGLTGGIGSGKSTVALLLARLGATVIDADAISRSVTAPHGAAITPLSEAFGASMLTAEGALDREKMRQLVYADPNARIRLEHIVHPLVGQEIARQTQQAQDTGAACIVFDIPLLVESKHWRKALHRILVVDCSPDTQIERVIRRNGLDRAAVQKIMGAQAERMERLKAADLVVSNEGLTIDNLAQQVHEIGTQFRL